MYDGHGNVVRTIDTSFGLSAYQWRGVWGERQTSTLQTGKGYCANLGHQEDETGLIYMRARYYEPTTGRFVSEDPARDGVNWYLYADGNAVNRVDADGKISLLAALAAVWFILGLIVGVGAGYAFATYLIQQNDPEWVGDPNWFARMGLLSFGYASVTMYATLKTQGSIGLSWGPLIAKLGLVGGVGFIIGFSLGMLQAYLEHSYSQ
jgi:RHS repeat-associated protein